MARLFSGKGSIEAARQARDSAETAAELREALAVLLPLEAGLNLTQTAQVLGRSKGSISTMRNRFCQQDKSGQARHTWGKSHLRNRAKSTLQKESEALDKVLKNANKGSVLTIPELRAKMESALGHSISLAGFYRLLKRHGWRKIAPDTQHPKGDQQVRDDWKKNSARCWMKVVST